MSKSNNDSVAVRNLQNAEVQQKMGEDYLRINHKKVSEDGYGDITIQVWRDNAGNPYVKMYRGNPLQKTFCIEHFLQFANSVQRIADILRERIGEI